MNISLYGRIAALIFALSVLLCCASCSEEILPEVYDTGKGLTITMEEGMESFESDGVTAGLAGENCMMTAVRHDYEWYADMGYDIEPMTVEEYAALLAELSEMDEKFSRDGKGNYRTTYNAEVDGEEYFYYGIIVKDSDAFWMVTLACRAKTAETYSALFPEWGSSITLE